MPRLASRLIPAAACLWCAALWITILPDPVNLATYIVLAFVYTLPGWPLATLLLGKQADRLTWGLVALPLGYVSGAVLTVLLRLAGIGSPWMVLSACVITGLGLLAASRRTDRSMLDAVALNHRDRIALGVLWLAALAIAGPVFARVGEPTSLGLAYRAYFNADLFVHMAVVAEVAKGSSPPANPFFPTEALPYYWTYFAMPAVFSQLRPALAVDPAIMLTDLTMAVVFVSIGFLLLRNVGASAAASAGAWLVILFASSYEGAFFIWDQWTHGRPLAEFRTWNIDAVTRWVWNLPGVDGFHRGMWWTPQHLMALTLGMLVMWLLVKGRTRPVASGIAEGLLLGAILIVSSFNGVMLVAWYALTHLALLAYGHGRGVGPWLLARGIAAVLVLLFLSVATSSGMVQRIPDAFLFGWNRFFLRGPWAFLLLSFGAALFFAPLGVSAMRRTAPRLLIAVGALLVIAALVFLQLDLRGHENTQVTFRTGQLWYVGLATLLAFALDAWRQRWTRISKAALASLLLASVLAVPTVAMDWYNARDISNIENSPGNFPWTLHISPDDQVAAAWIHRVLPPDATVQTDALPRDRNTWAFIPAFAQRRMGTGNGIFTLNPNRYLPNMREIHHAYGAATVEEAHDILRRVGADYLYVGDVERRTHGEALAKFASQPRLFEPVFWRGSVTIYQITR